MATISERLTRYCKHKGIAVSTFEKEAGLCNAYVRSVKKSIGADKAARIRAAWPDLNIDWVLFGTGDMLIDSAPQPAQKNIAAGVYNERAAVEDSAWLIKMYEDLRRKDAEQILDLQKQLYAAEFRIQQLQQQLDEKKASGDAGIKAI